MKHKYIRELFSEKDLPFPYSEEDYHDFDNRDTFNMDCTIIAWMYQCLRFFQDEASQIVNFDYHRFDIDGEELTQRQCIDRMVEDCKVILLYNDLMFDDWQDDKKYIDSVVNPAKDDLFKVFSKVYWAMWW